MKLVTFTDANGTRIGALTADGAGVVDLHKADASLPTDMIALLEGGEDALAKARAAAASAIPLPLSEVKLEAPIQRPGKIICIGLNYRDHAAETGQAIPTHPTVFAKWANVIVAHGDPIPLPRNTEQVDYEAEFVFVIGKRARDVSEADALSHVAGYAPFNDVSARDFQGRTSQWTMGKTFDGFGPFGPSITTADEIADPHNLDISLEINGEELQRSNTRELIFNINQLIADLSSVMTLEPGDIVSTGTPSGVGMARNPKRWLRAGDVVSVTIEGLGTLTNPVVAS